MRDIVGGMAAQYRFGAALAGPATGYLSVYALEVTLLVATLFAMAPLVRRGAVPGAGSTSGVARADPLDTLVEFYAKLNMPLQLLAIDVSGSANQPQVFINPQILARSHVGWV